MRLSRVRRHAPIASLEMVSTPYVLDSQVNIIVQTVIMGGNKVGAACGQRHPWGRGKNPPLQGTERVSEATEAGNREIAKKIGDLLQEEEKELARLHDMIAKKEDLIQTLKAIQKSLGVSSRLQ